MLRAARPGGEKPKILQCPDETAEAETVVDDIRSRLGVDGLEPRDFAILFRTNEQPRAFEMELRQAKLPYVLVGGMSFYDRKEVRDILAYLKLLANPADEVSLLRIINMPARGIGQATRRAADGPGGQAAANRSGHVLDAVDAGRRRADRDRRRRACKRSAALIERYRRGPRASRWSTWPRH